MQAVLLPAIDRKRIFIARGFMYRRHCKYRSHRNMLFAGISLERAACGRCVRYLTRSSWAFGFSLSPLQTRLRLQSRIGVPPGHSACAAVNTYPVQPYVVVTLLRQRGQAQSLNTLTLDLLTILDIGFREGLLAANSANSGRLRHPFQELLGLLLAIGNHLADERWAAIQLRNDVQLSEHLDLTHFDVLVPILGEVRE